MIEGQDRDAGLLDAAIVHETAHDGSIATVSTTAVGDPSPAVPAAPIAAVKRSSEKRNEINSVPVVPTVPAASRGNEQRLVSGLAAIFTMDNVRQPSRHRTSHGQRDGGHLGQLSRDHDPFQTGEVRSEPPTDPWLNLELDDRPLPRCPYAIYVTETRQHLDQLYLWEGSDIDDLGPASPRHCILAAMAFIDQGWALKALRLGWHEEALFGVCTQRRWSNLESLGAAYWPFITIGVAEDQIEYAGGMIRTLRSQQGSVVFPWESSPT